MQMDLKITFDLLSQKCTEVLDYNAAHYYENQSNIPTFFYRKNMVCNGPGIPVST